LNINSHNGTTNSRLQRIVERRGKRKTSRNGAKGNTGALKAAEEKMGGTNQNAGYDHEGGQTRGKANVLCSVLAGQLAG